MELVELKSKLEVKFPEYQFKIGKRIYGRCLIAKKTKYSGADLYIRKDDILIEAGIPEMRTRLLIGSGAVLLKKFKKDYNEPCKRIYDFLDSSNIPIKIRE